MIINERPPNFERIHAAFPDADKPGVMFAYDGKIYHPSGGNIPPALIAHEHVHLASQAKMLGGADMWWDAYVDDSEFRYREELMAHVAEFKVQRSSDRNFSARLLLSTALRLVAPLYNYQPPRTLNEALRDLRKEIAK